MPNRTPSSFGFVARFLMAVGVVASGLGLLVASPTNAGASTRPSTTVVRAALPPGKINHILVIEMENEGYAATFGSGSPATYLNGTLRKKGELLQKYYAIGHESLDNYISQVSGQSANEDTNADCSQNGGAFADVKPGTPDPNRAANPGQVVGQGCVYPASVPTIASQLDAKYPPNSASQIGAWRAYEQDMGNTPARDGGVADPTGGTDCAHPAQGSPVNAVEATPQDQYVTRHNPFVWFHSVLDNTAQCAANDVPLGTLGSNGKPAPNGHLARDLQSESTTPTFGFITPNVCNDGHDATCTGTNSTGGHQGGLAAADQFLRAWMPLILRSPAYQQGDMLVVITFDESDTASPGFTASCCHQVSGPNTSSVGGGQVGALLLNSKYIVPGSTDKTGSYNHYSALRSYEDLLGLTTGGTDGEGHLGFAAAKGLAPFGTDVFPAKLQQK